MAKPTSPGPLPKANKLTILVLAVSLVIFIVSILCIFKVKPVYSYERAIVYEITALKYPGKSIERARNKAMANALFKGKTDYTYNFGSLPAPIMGNK